MSYDQGGPLLTPEQKSALKKLGCLTIVVLATVWSCTMQLIKDVIGVDQETSISASSGAADFASPDALLNEPTETPLATETATASATPAKKPSAAPKKPALAPIVFNVVNTASCSATGCLTVAVHANVACKTITVSADVYDDNDEWIDTVEQSFRGLANGKSRQFTLTDDEYEDWQLELSDVLCG